MDISNLILSDEQLNVIDNGTWVGGFEEAPNVEFYVLGFTSEPVRKAIEAKQAALRKVNRNRPLTNAQLERITQETLAEVVLKDWRGLKDNGEEVKYDKELATKWLTSRNGAAFAELVLQASRIVDADTAEFVKGVKKS